MNGPGSLSRRLALLTSAGFVVIWLLAGLATALVLRHEQEELLDLQLRETARLFLPVLAERWAADGAAAALPPVSSNPDEALVYLLVDPAGRVLLRSPSAAGAALPEGPPRPGHVRTATHAFHVTEPNAEGLAAIYGDPLHERRDAYRESLLAFLLPMLALLPLAYVLVGRIARAALRPLDHLRAEIEARGDGRLDPIDAAGQPWELRAITATTNGLMMRLGQALDGERAFATNAAHELRTPVAVALAQTQRLRAEATGPALDRIDRIEAALTRMSRLVARLLQLARADAGLGAAPRPHDLRALLDHVLDDSRRNADRAGRLRLSLPDGPVLSPIDPDAFAILAGNLIDNAFQHSPAGSPVTVALTEEGCLAVRNEGPLVNGSDLSGLTRRFQRTNTSTDGFGLGLHIADTIARQSGGTLTLHSPATARDSGFEARFRAPKPR
ncbi:HAMP domain-containing sensor histidine kinase [Paracoccus sp. (in: a-proteobacteria)]|uniref:sensor histidine kinase n=1 Tax=Paracoccus sp. TaxID=267 RepID=UPI0026DEEB33|nr:HAMP domain-containing sensor histidine kinase [Paracoccus sp. (in: a-proteobacteria)]MDO5370980.1 HAMP domain-containing sensor histidine kinase [Paracoccus sp. (in: a-proteobacteria)]